MSRFVDTIVAYRILSLLLTPIKKTEAYKLGIVDEKGKQLKKTNTIKEQDAYTFLHKVIFKVKNILTKIPNYETDLRVMASAGRLVNECIKDNNDSHLDDKFNEILERIDDEDINNYIKEINHYSMKTFKEFRQLNEEGMASIGAPANNAAVTKGVDGFTPETLGIRKKDKPKILRRKKVN